MKVTREFCDVCEVEFADDRFKHGLCITIGHSPGGWGHRENLLEWSGVVCGACYQVLGPPAANWWRSARSAQRVGFDPPRTPEGQKAGPVSARVVPLRESLCARVLRRLGLCP